MEVEVKKASMTRIPSVDWVRYFNFESHAKRVGSDYNKCDPNSVDPNRLSLPSSSSPLTLTQSNLEINPSKFKFDSDA